MKKFKELVEQYINDSFLKRHDTGHFQVNRFHEEYHESDHSFQAKVFFKETYFRHIMHFYYDKTTKNFKVDEITLTDKQVSIFCS